MKIRLIIYCVLFVVSSFITTFFLYLFFKDDNVIDPEYAVITFDSEIKTREYSFDNFSHLYFLYDRDPLTTFSKKTKLLDGIPELNIVDSEEYKVVITSNSDVFDKIKINTFNDNDRGYNSLIITFTDDCYVPVHTDNISYDYDDGLYVEFDKFEVTVYGKVSSLLVDSAISLNYMTPKCEKLYIEFSYEGTEANIYNINTGKLTLYCSGTSHIKLSGKVDGNAKIYLYHNTKVDANKLTVGEKEFDVSSMMFALSYIKYHNIYYVLSSDTLISVILYIILFQPFVWIFIILFVCIKIKKRRNEEEKNNRDNRLTSLA